MRGNSQKLKIQLSLPYLFSIVYYRQMELISMIEKKRKRLIPLFTIDEINITGIKEKEADQRSAMLNAAKTIPFAKVGS